MARPPAVEQVQVNFRMPADLKARIEAAASENNRSTTAEIVATLEEKYPHKEEISRAQLEYEVLRDMANDIHQHRHDHADASAALHYLAGKMEEVRGRLPHHLAVTIDNDWYDAPPEFGLLVARAPDNRF